VVAVFSLVQTLEGFLITPKIVGETIGLHPITVMLAILVGGEFFGFIGILFALPLAAVIKVLADRLVTRYKSSDLYLLENPPEPE